MKTYYDPKTKFSISVDSGKIVYVSRKPMFSSDAQFSPDEEMFFKCAVIGTAYHSGESVPHAVKYMNKEPMLINLSKGIKMGVLQHYSVCDKTLDIDDFIDKNFISFFTPETELMPLLGYVVKMEKLNNPSFSLYETMNINSTVDIEAQDSLPGDNLGQMCQKLCEGYKVKNEICKTVLQNPFYGKTLSITPQQGQNTAFMTEETFNELFKAVPLPVKDIAKIHPVKMEVNPKVIEFSGASEIEVMIVSEKMQAASHCVGFINFFSEGKKNILFAGDDDAQHVAYWNGVK